MYFSVRFFSNIEGFDVAKADIGYTNSESIIVSSDKGGGGNPSCAEFYMNPQYIVELNNKNLTPTDRLSVHPVFISY